MDQGSQNELGHTEIDRSCIDQSPTEWAYPVAGKAKVGIAQSVALVASVVLILVGALGEFLAVSAGRAGLREITGISSVANLVDLTAGFLGLGLARYPNCVRGFLVTAGVVYLALGLVGVVTSDPGSPMTVEIESSIGTSELHVDHMAGPLLYLWLGAVMEVVAYAGRTRAHINSRYRHDQW